MFDYCAFCHLVIAPFAKKETFENGAKAHPECWKRHKRELTQMIEGLEKK